jgi:hypothetical protein
MNVSTILLLALFMFGCATTAKHWGESTSANTIAAYEDFVQRHPKSEYVAEARQRLEILYAERDWAAAGQANDTKAYEDFVQRHPKSEYVAEARQRLDVLYAERDWAAAGQANDTKAYEDFVQRHPKSRHVGDAESQIRLFEQYREGWERLQQKPTAQSFSDYCSQNPGSPYLSRARAAIADMEGRDIVDLIAEKKIEIEAKGSGIQSVRLRIRRLVPYPITVRVPVGSYLVASRRYAQNMVTTAEGKVVLAAEDWRSVSVAAACANRPRDIPGGGDTFSVQRSPHQEELAQLMPVLDKAGVTYATRQAAVWIVTDNASYSDLGILVTRSQFQAFGGTRTIRETETARAMKICTEAGIDVTRKRIWNDRSTIFQGLADGDLRKWFEEKMR